MKLNFQNLWLCIKEKFISIKERIIQEYRLRDMQREEQYTKDTLTGLWNHKAFVDKLGQYCKAECETQDAKYEITYNPRYTTGIKKDKLELFKNEHPDLYDKYVTTTESRTFSIRLLKAS